MRENLKDNNNNVIDEVSENETQNAIDNHIDTEMMDAMVRETFEEAFDIVPQSIDPSRIATLEATINESDSSSQKIWRYPITVSIGMAHIPEEKLISLKEEDIIPLDQTFDLPIIIKTSEGKTFKGKLGKLGKNYAIKLI